MSLTDIFYKYAGSVVPMGWSYHSESENVPFHRSVLIEGRYNGQPLYVFPCATAFLLSIDENRARLVTANHAFPDLQRDNAEVCVIVPDFFKCPYEISADDLKAYLGVEDFIRLEQQDICVFEVNTPEALYLQNPVPFSLSLDFRVGDEVCTIGYPFVGCQERVTAEKKDVRFVEILTSAHLSAVWPFGDTLTLEFDNYVGPGNSGGPLINVRTGAVIGAVTWIRLEGHSATTFSHATCIMEIIRARDRFPDLPDIVDGLS